MGVNVAVFVPEGIVLSSDCFSEIRTNDDGFFHTSVVRTFELGKRFIVSFVGNGYLCGLPCGFYIEYFKCECLSLESSTKKMAEKLMNFLKKQVLDEERISFYIAGYDIDKFNKRIPCIYLVENDKYMIINQDQKSEPVYNYHSIGRSFWINKLLLNTGFQDEMLENFTRFDDIYIDFSKYSIVDAKNFSEDLIKVSSLMDKYAQFKPMISDNVTIGILLPFDGASIIKNIQ